MWLRQQLARQVDGSSLGLFRIVWGLLMVWETIHRIPKATGMYSPDYFHFTYELFPFVRPFPTNWMMQVEISVMLLAAVLITAGYLFRYASALFLVIFTHLFLIEKLYYNNHFYLTILLSALLMVSSADRCYRLPFPWKWKKSTPPANTPSVPTIPLWNLVLLRSQVVVLYFFGGVAKLNSDWLAGEPIRYWFAQKGPDHVLAGILTQEWFIWLVCWTGLILDLFAGLTLISRRTRVLTMLLLIVFHSTNAMLFQIGLFPIIGVGLLLLFIDPDRPRKIFHWIGQFSGVVKVQAFRPAVFHQTPQGALSWTVTGFVCGWIALQVLLPMRIIKYQQNPGWTEVGQCFSWRMMLRTKDGFLQLQFDPPAAERYLETHPEILPKLSTTHLQQMVKNPLFILQYSHAVSEALEKAGQKGVKIKCVSIASMNGRPYQLMIDPEVDLTQVNYGLFEVPRWILPLYPNQTPGQYPANPAERAELLTKAYRSYIQGKQTPALSAEPVKYAEALDYSGSVH